MSGKDEVANTLHQIGKDLGIPKTTQAVVPVVTSIIQRNNGHKVATVVKGICRIGSGVKDLFNSSYDIKLKGVMTIVSAAWDLFPVVESGVKEFAFFMASLLGCSVGYQPEKAAQTRNSNSPGRFEEVMKIIIADAFATHMDALLKSEADSISRVLSFAHNILIGFQSKSDEEITEHEITNLMGLVDINAGVKALGNIESRIQHLIQTLPKMRSESEMSECCRKVNKYVDMYCRLAILRDAVMLELYAVITYSGHASHLANGILKGLESEQEHDRNLVKCLVLPQQDQVQFASFFDPGRWPLTCKFMENRNVFNLIENLENAPVAMNTIKWMNWFVSHGGKTSVYLGSEGCAFHKHVRNKQHNFFLRKKDNDTCYYVSPQGNPNVYAVMCDGADKWVKLKTGLPGREGEWNIFNIRNMDSIYMLSTRRWPIHFLCMSDTCSGWLQGRAMPVSDPQGHWVIQYNGSKA